jgi:hypothetical protein
MTNFIEIQLSQEQVAILKQHRGRRDLLPICLGTRLLSCDIVRWSKLTHKVQRNWVTEVQALQ